MATVSKKQKGFITCVGFETQAEEAVKFYTSVFKNSKTGKTTYYGDNAPMPEGTVLTIPFELNGQSFLAMNGGSYFGKFTDSVSFIVNCKNQEEIDHYWEKLSKGGKKVQCGWLRDKFGISWQIVPDKFSEWMSSKDPAKINRMMQAVMKMKKLDMKKMERAFNEKG